jgi:hypothetical protein
MTQDINNVETPTKDMAATPMTDLEEGGTKNGEKKHAVRTGDKSNEEVVIPKNRIFIVFIGLMLTVFLAALDQTIVCTFLTSTLKTNLSNGASYHCTGFKRCPRLLLDWNKLSSCFGSIHSSLRTC